MNTKSVFDAQFAHTKQEPQFSQVQKSQSMFGQNVLQERPDSLKALAPSEPHANHLTHPMSMSSMRRSVAVSAPSHPYSDYTQQTGMIPGALADSLDFDPLGPIGDLDSSELMAEFNAMPEFSQRDLFFDQMFVNPVAIQQQQPATTASVSIATSSPAPIMNVFPRMYPGIHQAYGSANNLYRQYHRQQEQAQQQQQQQMPQQQMPPQQQAIRQQAVQQPVQQQTLHQQPLEQQMLHQQQASCIRPLQQSRPGYPPVAVPTAEPSRSVHVLFNRLKGPAVSPPTDSDQDPSPAFMARRKNELDEMDPDARLLASEEGKRLSSKQRRQLRNKVSARAFRIRRKDHMVLLEGKVSDAERAIKRLEAANASLTAERGRTQDFIRYLVSSSSVSSAMPQIIASYIAANPEPLPAPAPNTLAPALQEQTPATPALAPASASNATLTPATALNAASMSAPASSAALEPTPPSSTGHSPFAPNLQADPDFDDFVFPPDSP